MTFDVVVIGGGIVGLSAAIAMRQRGCSVAVIDAGSMVVETSSGDSRVYAINQSSENLLRRLHVWEHLDQGRLSPYRHMHVWDAASGASIDFDATMVALNRLGTIIEETNLKQALLARFKIDEGICFVNANVDAVEITQDGIGVQQGAQALHARLLIVADGALSNTREQLGVKITQWSYDQHAIVAMVQTENEHAETAYQVFNADGPLAFLPLVEGHHSSIVWSTTPAHACYLMALPEEDFNTKLTEAFALKLGKCKLIGSRRMFPLHMRHAAVYGGAHWLLMGDAAHTVHPLAGLGLNLGLADVTAWVDLLETYTSRAQWDRRTVSAYQRQRKHAVWQTIMLLEGLQTIFGHSSSPFVQLRRLGLRACNGLPLLKRFFIEQAVTV